MSKKTEQLASKVLHYKRLYYTGQETVKDEVYDQLEGELRRLAPDHPVLSLVGAEAFSMGIGEEVPHDPPMLSLEKTYLASDVVRLLKDEGELCLTLKIDGMSCKLEYDEAGVLRRASTRGSGTKGENVTSRLMHNPTIPKRIKGAWPAGTYTVEVRGELYFPLKAFDLLKAELKLESIRNAVQGLLTRKDIADALAGLEALRFVAYEVIIRRVGGGAPLRPAELHAGFDISSQTGMLAFLKDLGFDLPEFELLSWDPALPEAEQAAKVASKVSEFFDREGRDLAFDGLVLRINDLPRWLALGATSHHPRGSLAFKRQGDTAVSRILGITVGVGRTGKISFTARLAPFPLSGATISSATLHNAAFIEKGGYLPGAYVRLVRSGEVIPKVLESLMPGDEDLEAAAAISAGAPVEPFSLPTACGCGAALERRGPDLFCPNTEGCSERGQNDLAYFLKTIEVKGVADKMIEKVVAAGLVRSQADFFRLTAEALEGLPGVGKKSAQNTVGAIQACRQVDLGIFFGALGIPGVGRSKSRQLASLFRTVERIRLLTESELQEVDGWGKETTQAFLAGIAERKALIDDLLSVMEVKERQAGAEQAGRQGRPGNPEETGEGAGKDAGSGAAEAQPLAGKVLVITGALSKPRKEIEKLIEAAGGKNGSDVSAKTSFLVCNEPSGSSKSKKATALGVKVISEEELMAMVSGS